MLTPYASFFAVYLLDIDNSDTEKEPWFKLEFGKKVENDIKKTDK